MLTSSVKEQEIVVPRFKNFTATLLGFVTILAILNESAALSSRVATHNRFAEWWSGGRAQSHRAV
jgi:hypothetical protein